MDTYILASTINSYSMVDLLAKHISITGIITIDKKHARQNHEHYDYRKFCQERNILCIETSSYSLKSESDYDMLSQIHVDLLLVLGWQRLVPDWFISQCNIGAIGVHGSPWGITAGRGRSPQNWALLLGCCRFSVSIFWLDAKADSGKVIDTSDFQYSETDDINTSYLKVSYLVVEMLLKNLQNGKIEAKTGETQAGDTAYLPKRSHEDGQIDWNRNGRELYDFVRALTKPYPGAFTTIHHHVIHIWRAKYLSTLFFGQHECGEIIQILPDNQLIVKCRDGVIVIDEYENEDAIELSSGDVFESADFKLQIENIVNRHYAENGGLVNRNITKIFENEL